MTVEERFDIEWRKDYPGGLPASSRFKKRMIEWLAAARQDGIEEEREACRDAIKAAIKNERELIAQLVGRERAALNRVTFTSENMVMQGPANLLDSKASEVLSRIQVEILMRWKGDEA